MVGVRPPPEMAAPPAEGSAASGPLQLAGPSASGFPAHNIECGRRRPILRRREPHPQGRAVRESGPCSGGSRARGRGAVGAQNGGAGGSARGPLGRPGGFLGAWGLQKGRSARGEGWGCLEGAVKELGRCRGPEGGLGVSRVRGVPLRPWRGWRVWGYWGSPERALGLLSAPLPGRFWRK